MTNIEYPALPDAVGAAFARYTATQLQNYAMAAVMMDRQARNKLKFDAAEIDLPACVPRGIWQEWSKYRKSCRKPINAMSAKRQLNLLEIYHKEGHDVTKAIEFSIASGYQGIFPAKVNGSFSKRFNPTEYINQGRTYEQPTFEG